MDALPEPQDRTAAAASAGRPVLRLFVLAAAYLAAMLILRDLGWLPRALGEPPVFGYVLAVGFPVLGVLDELLRTRRPRARSSG